MDGGAWRATVHGVAKSQTRVSDFTFTFDDQCRLQLLQFLVHLIDLLSFLLRCNGFTGIQKVVTEQTGSRPPNSDHDRFLVQVWLWEMLWSFYSVQPLSWLLSAVVYNPLFVTGHNPIEKWFIFVEWHKRRQYFRMTVFLICCQLMRHSLSKLFHLSNLFQMPNVCRMVDGEFFCSFTCSCMRISFNDAFN